jgi:uncharacterized RDD family membrane protein YckC
MSTGCGCVLFAPSDYAGLARRLAAMLIDLAVTIGLFAAVASVAALAVVPRDVWLIENDAQRQVRINEQVGPIQLQISLACIGLVTAYHVLGRMLPGGTAGYRLAAVRIIDATGRTPSPRTLLKRFLLAVPFTLLLGASYFLVNRNPRRQAAHDQWSGTWVIRKRATPIGPAKPAYQTKLLGTILLTYLDLEPADADVATAPGEGGQMGEGGQSGDGALPSSPQRAADNAPVQSSLTV